MVPSPVKWLLIRFESGPDYFFTAKINKMKVEIVWNNIGGSWWFDLGISCQQTEYHPNKKMVFAIALGLVTIYIRW
jgi:hypothetical protein